MITWNHKAKGITEALGLNTKRWDEVIKALQDAVENDKTHCNSEVIAAAIKSLRTVTDADYLLIGYIVGCKKVQARYEAREKKQDLVKLMEGLTAILKKDDDK